MLCAVYKSSLKADTYLFINKKDDFTDVPEKLLAMFGPPKLVLVFAIGKKQHLGVADIEKVRLGLADNGYYLQLPPPQKNLLKTHRQSLGLE